MSEPAMTPDPNAKTALLAAAVMGFFIVGCGMAIFGPALPVFVREFGLTTASAGWLVSTLWIGCLLGVVAMYFWSERVSAQPGMLVLAFGAAILALSPVWMGVVAGAFIFGLGYGAIAAQFNPRILIAFGPRGPSMLSLINAVFSLGSIAAPYGFVVLGGNPRPVFGAVAVLALLAWGAARKAGMTGVQPALSGKGFRLHLPILSLALLAIGIEASLAGLGPTGLIRSGMGEVDAARLLSAFFAVTLLTRLVLIAVAARIPAFGLFTFAALWAALCALLTIWVSPLIFFPAMGISTGLFFQAEYVTASRKMGDDPRVPSIILGNGLLGAVIAPIAFAKLMDGFGDHGFFWLVAIVAGGVGLVSLVQYRAMSR
jgi:MFS transporter, FHS family, glucose/mannose:H+ symporter